MTMWFLMIDHLVKRPVGILHDVLVKVQNFMFLVDFVILDCEVHFEVPIIFHRPLISTGKVLVNMEYNELKFMLNNKSVIFNICQSLKQPRGVSVISIINNEIDIEITIEEIFEVEKLAIMMMNFDLEDIEDYEKIMSPLDEMRSYSYAPKKLDLTLKNSPPVNHQYKKHMC